MRTAQALGMLAVSATRAFADDVDSIHLSERAEHAALPAPLLELERPFGLAVEANGEGLGSTNTHHRALYELPLGIDLSVDGVERTNAVDLPTRGWRTEAWLHRDLGFATLSVGGAVENVESRDLRGTYRQLGAALTRTFQLSRGRLAWLSLSISKLTWQGTEPPPGESNGTVVMLGFGFTF